MQYSQILNLPKNAIWLFFHHQILKSTLETQIKAYAVFANAQHAENCYLADFSSSTFENALETEIMAYAAFAIVQRAEKRIFAVFSSSSFEIYSRNANKGICSIRKCSTCRKTRFCSVFIIKF